VYVYGASMYVCTCMVRRCACVRVWCVDVRVYVYGASMGQGDRE